MSNKIIKILESNCKVCNGLGFVIDKFNVIICAFCHGNGYIE